MTSSQRADTRRAALPFAPWVFGACLLVLWWGLAASGSFPAFMLPSPDAVGSRLLSDLADPVLWPYAGRTFAAAVGGCVLGAAVALPLATAIHTWRVVDAALTPFLGATQAIPAIAIAPLLVLWTGYGLGPITLLCALLVFFPILIAAVVGLRHVDGSVVDAARMDGASGWALLVHIEIPMALPTILAGLRNGFALSVTGAIVGEMVMGGQGLGQLLTIQRDALDTAGMFATIIVLCLMASLLYGAIRHVERTSRTVAALTPDRKASS